MSTRTLRRASAAAALLVCAALPALAAGGGGDDHASGGFPIYETINFVLLIAVLVYFARKPVLGYFADRHSQIKGDIGAAAELLEQAEHRNAEWQRRLADLDRDLDDIRRASRERAEEERERILAEAQESAERIQRDAVASVDQELRRAKTELRKEAAALATELAAQMLDQRVDDSDRDRLLDEFISRVESSGGAGTDVRRNGSPE